MSGGGAAKPPEIHFEVRDEIGGRGVVHGYGMTEVPMIANGSPHDTDEQLANTDGRAGRGGRGPDRAASTARSAAARRGGRDPGARAHGLPRVHRPVAQRRRPSTSEGYFRTGDLGPAAGRRPPGASPAG